MGLKKHFAKFKRGANKLGDNIGKVTKSASDKYKDWESRAPERQQKRIQALKRQEQEMNLKAKIARHKQSINKSRPSMSGGSPFDSFGAPSRFGGAGFGDPFGMKPGQKKKSTKKRPRKKEVFYY